MTAALTAPREAPDRVLPPGPSPGRARYLTLVLVLVLAGSYAGLLISNQMTAPATVTCLVKVRDSGNVSLSRFQACFARFDSQRMAAEAAGGFAVLPPGLLLMWLLPWRLARRAGPLTRAPENWQQEALRMARGGTRRRVVVEFGRLGLREPFTVPTPRGFRIILPWGVRKLPYEQWKAVLRHEIEHAVAGDVSLVWLTRGVWWTLPAALLAPVLARVGAAWADSTSPVDTLARPFWAEYGLRAVGLLLLTALMSAAVLRSREHEADLHAAAAEGGALAAVLRGNPASRPPWWRRVSANHPSPARRLAALADPSAALRVTTLETVAAGAAVAMTLVAVQRIFLSSSLDTSAPLIAGLLGGVLFAFGWAGAVWRTVGARPGTSVRGPLLGLAAGTAIGMVGGLWNTGLTLSAPLYGWPSLFLVPLLVANAGACSAALAGLWARTGPGRRRFPRFSAHLANIVLFVGALWIGHGVAIIVRLDIVRAVVLGAQSGPWTTPAAVALAVVSLIAWRWTRGSGIAASGGGLLLHMGIGLTAGSVAATLRWATTPAFEARRPFYSLEVDCWTAVGAGLCCVVVLLLVSGREGLGRSLAVAPVATAITSAILWVRFVTEWKHLALAAKIYAVRPLAQLALCLLVVVLLAAFLPSGGSKRRFAPVTVLAATALLSFALVAALVFLAPRVPHGLLKQLPMAATAIAGDV
ncbi:M48 family metalloprotease [Actinomadura roseirufa]|uniref:M48 family metalloprotease n=1 Tax=Actinomadura roseirufa TaxID=2094049 RepID=UPI001041B06C|nr:M48 family metalloprotease [Actinomadura roseirufa]